MHRRHGLTLIDAHCNRSREFFVDTTCGACRERPTHNNNTICDHCLRAPRDHKGRMGLVPALRLIADGPAVEHMWERLIPQVAEITYRRTSPSDGLAAEVQTAVTKQHRLVRLDGPGKPGRLSESPLPFHSQASEVADDLSREVLQGAGSLAHSNPHLTPPAPLTVEAAARWMAGLPGLLAMLPDAAAIHAGICDAVRKAERVIDRGPERVRLGRCGALVEGRRCDSDLYGAKENPEVACRVCGTVHDAGERWLDMQARVRESLATAAEIAEAARAFFGRAVNAKTIRTWTNRGLVGTYSHNADGVPLLKVDEVLKFAAGRTRGQVAKAA